MLSPAPVNRKLKKFLSSLDLPIPSLFFLSFASFPCFSFPLTLIFPRLIFFPSFPAPHFSYIPFFSDLILSPPTPTPAAIPHTACNVEDRFGIEDDGWLPVSPSTVHRRAVRDQPPAFADPPDKRMEPEPRFGTNI